ncbi:MAG TPA: hypothetical protein VMB21_22120 [Candidatus Limnocylindria bacterium]|nr:hypothetical protein [Candidatus Limnocylindria bacterium]
MSGLLPLIQRELRMAARVSPPIRAHWKTFGLTLLAAVFLLVIFRLGGGFGLFQGFFGMVTYALSRAPLLFANDQEAGSQSLLRLAGLNSAAVLWGSLLGSLLLVLEGTILMAPVLIAGLWLTGTRPQGVVLLALLPLVVLTFGTIIRAVGRLCARTVAAAHTIAVGLAMLTVGLPILLEWLFAAHLGPVARRALYLWGGLHDWTSIPSTCAGHGNGTGAGRLVLRFLLWSAGFGILATGLFHRQWRQSDGRRGIFGRWRDLWGGTAVWRRSQLPLALDAAYSWRLRRNRSWAHSFPLVAAVLGLVGVAVAILLPWPALVLTAMAYVAAVDTLLHFAVSQPVAEDRRAGSFELLLTTGLEPREVFDSLNAEAQRLRRGADLVGIPLLLVLFLLSLGKLWRDGSTQPHDWVALGLTWCWPLAYALSLRWLSFAKPIWQAANAATLVNESCPPKTPTGLPLCCGLLLWFAVDGTYITLFPIAILGLVMVWGWLAVRENMAADVEFADADLRTVAAQPLPVEQWVALPKRKKGKAPAPTESAR